MIHYRKPPDSPHLTFPVLRLELAAEKSQIRWRFDLQARSLSTITVYESVFVVPGLGLSGFACVTGEAKLAAETLFVTFY